jgi:hypothetical protein
MLARRLAAVFMAFLMLHLSVVSSDAACATHMSDTHAHGQGMSMKGGNTSGSMNASMQARGGAVQEPQAPCDTPVQPNCCQALASCATVFAVGRASAPRQRPERAGVAATELLIPLSELIAPDPPPPKFPALTIRFS